MSLEPHADVLLCVRELSKSFVGQRALTNVSLTVRSGEVRGLVGHNGSGKSTLVKILAGYHTPDSGGDVLVDGSTVDLRRHDSDRRLHFIHQDLGLVGQLSTIENLALGRGYATGLGRRILWTREARRAQQLVTEFGMAFDVHTPVGRLAPAEQAAVAILRALQDWQNPRQVLVLDEPTAALSAHEVGTLFRLVRQLAAAGAAVVFVSHRLEEVLELCDSVTVLRDGMVVADEPIGNVDHGRLVELIAGRPRSIGRSTQRMRGETAVEVEGLRGSRVRDLSFAVSRGEILGVAGINGSGREEVADLVFGSIDGGQGLMTTPSGELRLPTTPPRAIAAGLALVPSDRPRRGAALSLSVTENMTLPRMRQFSRAGRIHRRAEAVDARRWAERVDLRPADPGRVMATLSGGNQQKVVVARWLAAEPAVMVLDEPTQGVDIGGKGAIHDLIRSAAASGAGILVCSSEAEELSALCDRVLVLRDGAVTAELSGSELTAHSIITACLGFQAVVA